MLSSMDSEPDGTGYSQRKAYDHVFNTLREALADALAKGSKRLLATYLQTLLAYPDGFTRGETVFDPAKGNILVQVPPLSEDRLYPKEQALVDLAARPKISGQAGGHQLATTILAGCSRWYPNNFSNITPFADPADFLMLSAAPFACAATGASAPYRNSLSRLWPVQMSDHSRFTFSKSRRRNCRKPRACLIWPNTGSTVPIRNA